FVDFERVRAVFEGIGDADCLGGELFRLSNRNKTCAKPVGQSGSKNEAARLDPRNDVNHVTVVVIAKPVNQGVKTLLVLQKRSQVVEEDARLRVIRHFADQLLQIVHSNVSPGSLICSVQALGLMTNPPSHCGSGVAGSSRTSLTLEKRGPRCNIARNSACWSAVAMTYASTRPSRRFLTNALTRPLS